MLYKKSKKQEKITISQKYFKNSRRIKTAPLEIKNLKRKDKRNKKNQDFTWKNGIKPKSVLRDEKKKIGVNAKTKEEINGFRCRRNKSPRKKILRDCKSDKIKVIKSVLRKDPKDERKLS